MVFAVVIVAMMLAPPLAVVGLVAADEREWRRFKKEVGIE